MEEQLPILGDDYPCVLRKMKNQIELTKKSSDGRKDFVLLVDKYDGIGATREQMIKIFRKSDIHVIFCNDLNSFF